MEKRMYLNGVLCDLPNSPITRTIRIGDVGDISNLKSSFSYTIKFPATSRNKGLFDFLGVPGNTSRKPFENIRVDYYEGSLLMVRGGYLVLRKSAEFYEGTVHDGVIDLAQKMGDSKLNELIMPEYDHILSIDNFFDSFDRTEGYIYAIADYGYNAGFDINVANQAPAFYNKTLLKKIIENLGIRYSGSIFFNNDLSDEIISPSTGYERSDDSYSETFGGNFIAPQISSNSLWSYYKTEQVSLDISENVAGPGISDSGGKLIFSQDGSFRIPYSAIYSVDDRTQLFLRIERNGEFLSQIPLENNETELGQTKDVEFYITAETGDELEFIAYANTRILEDGEEGLMTIDYNLTLNGQAQIITGGQNIRTSDYLGKMKQSDLLKDFFVRYGVVVNPVGGGNYEFKQIDTILNDRAGAEDWTNKVVDKLGENYESDYTANNTAKYRYEDENLTQYDALIQLDNENDKKENPFYTSPFRVPSVTGLNLTQKIYKIHLWDENDDGDVSLKEVPNGLFRVNKGSVTINATIFDNPTEDTRNVDAVYYDMLKIDLQYYFDKYWESFFDLMENFKEVEYTVDLDEVDIHNLNFTKLKYLKQEGRFYYLTEVRHTSGERARVKMLEITKFK